MPHSPASQRRQGPIPDRLPGWWSAWPTLDDDAHDLVCFFPVASVSAALARARDDLGLSLSPDRDGELEPGQVLVVEVTRVPAVRSLTFYTWA